MKNIFLLIFVFSSLLGISQSQRCFPSGSLSFDYVCERLGLQSCNLVDMGSEIGQNTPVTFPNDFHGYCYFEITPSSENVSPIVGSGTVNIKTHTDFTVESNQLWLTLSENSGVETRNITYNINANTSSNSRSAIITATLSNGETISSTITQGAALVSDVLKFSTVGSQNACNSNSGGTYYFDTGQTFSSTSSLYADASGTTNPPAGWYSDESISREWDGQRFISATINCAATYVAVTLTGGGNEPEACLGSNGPAKAFYIDSTQNFLTATNLYSDSSGTTSAIAGYYSDGTNVRQWNGVSFIQTNTCN